MNLWMHSDADKTPIYADMKGLTFNEMIISFKIINALVFTSLSFLYKIWRTKIEKHNCHDLK